MINLEPVGVGFAGCLEVPQQREFFVKRVEELYERDVEVFPFGPEEIRKVAVISGGSSPDWVHAFDVGADTFICGDMREHIVRAVEEAGMNVINAGHYATEKLGVRALSQFLTAELGIRVDFIFIDIPNPV